MASTNHTTNYNLSQYIATDKPTYLVDYNNDMLNIDTQMHTNATAAATAQTAAETADAKAVTADGKAVTAQSSAAAAQTSADSALAKIGTLSSLTTTDKTSIVNAVNEINGELSKIDLLHKGGVSVGAEITLSHAYTDYDLIIVGGYVGDVSSPYTSGQLTIPVNEIIIDDEYNVVSFRNTGLYLSLDIRFKNSTTIKFNNDYSNWAGNAGYVYYVYGIKL